MEYTKIRRCIDNSIHDIEKCFYELSNDEIMKEMEVLVFEFGIHPDIMLTKDSQELKKNVIEHVDKWYNMIHSDLNKNN